MPKLVNGKELSKLAQIDKNAPGDLARALLERSARLVAAAVAGTYEFSKKERLIFQTDGSLFWNGWEYKNNVKNELSNLGVAHHTITFFHLENIAMKGALNLVTRTQ